MYGNEDEQRHPKKKNKQIQLIISIESGDNFAYRPLLSR